MAEQAGHVLPRSPIGQAVSHARAHWQDLQTSTRDGDLNIDNNRSERNLRAQAIGRKNFLFVGSYRGGRTGATQYRFVVNRKRLGGDPLAYPEGVLERLPTHPIDRLAELLPDSWLAAHLRAFRRPDHRRRVTPAPSAPPASRTTTSATLPSSDELVPRLSLLKALATSPGPGPEVPPERAPRRRRGATFGGGLSPSGGRWLLRGGRRHNAAPPALT